MEFVKNKIFTIISLLTLIVILSLGVMARPLHKPKPNRLPAKATESKVMMQCESIGAPAYVVRIMRITNGTDGTLGKGKRLYWSTSDGEKGSMLMPENLSKGQSLRVYDNIGERQYTCDAWFHRTKPAIN
jgi:hypothetical protein